MDYKDEHGIMNMIFAALHSEIKPTELYGATLHVSQESYDNSVSKLPEDKKKDAGVSEFTVSNTETGVFVHFRVLKPEDRR